jgi:hypothetical protein
MTNKLKMTPNIYRGITALSVLLFCVTYSQRGIPGEFDTYRYDLEKNNNDGVCSHMAGVYNRYFKKPFAMTIDKAEYEKGEGNQPALLPGAKRDWDSYVDMRFSFASSSPEFDAIKWQVGTLIAPSAGEAEVPTIPFIAANMDINNDGQLNTVIKFEFMNCYISYHSCNPADSLSIFRKSDIDLMHGPIKWDVPITGQNGHRPLAVIYGRQSTCNIVRPFVYEGVTFLSCYHRKWLKDLSDYRKGTPHWEYTDVLKYRGVEDLGDGRKAIKADTVCQFRMTVAK